MRTDQAPRIEFIQTSSQEARERPRGGGPRRLVVFALVFVVLAAVGLAWSYARPAVYRASATVLTVKPKAVDARSEEADLEHVAIQGRALLSEQLLARVAADLRAEGVVEDLSGEGLRGMLTLAPVEQTNLVELRAEGAEPGLLQLAVNTWAHAYESHRQQQIAVAKAQTMTELEERQAALMLNIRQRQADLDAFRAEHDIVSLENADNRAPARLKGLNAALNKARERLVDAEAARAAIDTALRAGKVVMPKEQRAVFNARVLELETLKDRLAALNEKYTRAYLERDPMLKALPDQLASLEREVAGMRVLGQREVQEEADREVETARAAVFDLEQQLRQHEARAREFTALFAEHDAMQEEVERLQALHGDNAERLAQIEARNLEKYPPVQVVDRAVLPTRPIRPAYTRDAAIVVGTALVAALFFTWLVEYLLGHRRPEPQAYTGVRVYPGPEPAAIESGAAEPQLTAAPSGARLVAPAPAARELEHAELDALLRHADPVAAGCAALLLSGVAPEEIAGQGGAACELDQQGLLVAG
ncbi:MAG: hypothetical protein P8106_11565, partial [Gammaproteobacteria bacterium]